jgi:hypothetical protein
VVHLKYSRYFDLFFNCRILNGRDSSLLPVEEPISLCQEDPDNWHTPCFCLIPFLLSLEWEYRTEGKVHLSFSSDPPHNKAILYLKCILMWQLGKFELRVRAIKREEVRKIEGSFRINDCIII